jgi:GDPmannose 4,6-dehydratase
LKGDATKAKNKLGWIPEISFDELVTDMLQYDIKNV